MNTLIEKVDYKNPCNSIDVIMKGAEIINGGGLVAFPTETVYGLGANALDPSAVKKIYSAKGRPSDNPLIIHISEISELKPLVKEIPERAEILIKKFWPGALTIIFKKSELIPMEVTGGLDTVAVRFPKNEVARLFIKTCGVPVAAPSANSSGKPSPTRASHVEFDLYGKIDMIIDGGYAVHGLESTIVDLTGDVPCILRPGSVTREMLEACLGEVDVETAVNAETAPKAPGQKYQHYSPKAKLTIVKGKPDAAAGVINRLAKQSMDKNIKTGILATVQTKDMYDGCMVLVAGDRQSSDTIAANLFKMLRKFDYKGIENIYSESFEQCDLGMAIMNRLEKAAGGNIIEVSE